MSLSVILNYLLFCSTEYNGYRKEQEGGVQTAYSFVPAPRSTAYRMHHTHPPRIPGMVVRFDLLRLSSIYIVLSVLDDQKFPLRALLQTFPDRTTHTFLTEVCVLWARLSKRQILRVKHTNSISPIYGVFLKATFPHFILLQVQET